MEFHVESTLPLLVLWNRSKKVTELKQGKESSFLSHRCSLSLEFFMAPYIVLRLGPKSCRQKNQFIFEIFPLLEVSLTIIIPSPPFLLFKTFAFLFFIKGELKVQSWLRHQLNSLCCLEAKAASNCEDDIRFQILLR